METICYIIKHAEKLMGLIYDNNSKDNNEIKNEKQVLSIEGEEQAKKLAKIEELQNINIIYSSHYSRTIATAKYLAKNLNLSINIEERLGERIIGNTDKSFYKMLLNIQHHDFDYKAPNGESLNDTKKRITEIFNEIIDMNLGKEIVIFGHEIAFNCLLLNYCKAEYNLEDKLVLSYSDNLSIPAYWSSPDGYKITLKDKDVINIEKLEL